MPVHTTKGRPNGQTLCHKHYYWCSLPHSPLQTGQGFLLAQKGHYFIEVRAAHKAHEGRAQRRGHFFEFQTVIGHIGIECGLKGLGGKGLARGKHLCKGLKVRLARFGKVLGSVFST